MIRTINDFVMAWEFENAATQRVLANLTDASLSQKVSPEGRTLGFLAWHITSTIPEMLNLAGIPATGPEKDAPAPASAREIVVTYARAAASVVPALRSAWKDAELDEKIPMYGEQWRRSQVLSSLILHQAHHRGQMTVLMRQAGLKVPGFYGPAQEEWSAMGMDPMP